MARRKTILRCTCRQCTAGLRNRNGKRNAIYYMIHSNRRAVASLLRKANDSDSYDRAQDAYIASAGYTD